MGEVVGEGQIQRARRGQRDGRRLNRGRTAVDVVGADRETGQAPRPEVFGAAYARAELHDSGSERGLLRVTPLPEAGSRGVRPVEIVDPALVGLEVVEENA